ncbi:hypothetical protein Tco_1479853 [Tanacetum coccineum]
MECRNPPDMLDPSCGTLTRVAIENPAITQQVKDLLTAGVREGLKLVTAIEKELCTNHVLILAQSASTQIWSQVDKLHKLCESDLQTNEEESYMGFSRCYIKNAKTSRGV